MRKTVFVCSICVLLILSAFLPVSLPVSPYWAMHEVAETESSQTEITSMYNVQEYHTSDEVVSILQEFRLQYPALVNISVIGQSYEGKDIWAVTITNFSTGEALEKPAMLYVGPHHGNEMIGKEIALYFINFLLTHYGIDYEITRILDEKTVYVIPIVNVDGNDWTLEGASQRFNSRPLDEDEDGLLDEDPGEDLNGDGKITDMRKWNDTTETWDYYVEGIDNDLDGLYNFDWIGGVDLNRNYPKGWINYTGHGEYPFSELETVAVRDFVISHSNIATVFDTHSGAYCLIYPWAYTGALPPDNQLYELLRAKYENLTGYSYHRIGAQGTSDDWIYDTQSAICFTLELFGVGFYPGGPDQFDEDYPDQFVSWENFTHPQLGEVQIGGYWVFRGYNPPEEEIEEWALKVLPMLKDLVEITAKIEIAQLDIVEENGGGGTRLFNVSATIANSGFLATATLQALQTHTNSLVNVMIYFSANLELVDGDQTVSFEVIDGNATVNAYWQIRVNQPGASWITIVAISAKGGTDEAYRLLPSSQDGGGVGSTRKSLK